MGVTIKNKQGIDISTDTHYNWDYSWQEGSKQTNPKAYTYIAANTSNYQGQTSTVKLKVTGRMNNTQIAYSVERTHSFVAWPKQNVEDLSNSVQQKVMCGGQTLELAVNATGGPVNNWTYTWKKNGAVLSTETSNTLTTVLVNAPESSEYTDQYSITAKNSWDINKSNQWSYTYSVLIYPEPYMSANIAVVDLNRNSDLENGIREGNQIHYSSDCYGGYPTGWNYRWSLDGTQISNLKEETSTISSGISGDTKNTKVVNMVCDVANVYDNSTWATKQYNKTFTVYKKPQTPLSIVKKGNGTSATVIATSNVTDSDLESHDYYLVFGYRDNNGTMHDASSLRQHNPGSVRWSVQIPAAVLNNSNNTLYVYALWKYNNGVEITSGLRTANNVDEAWDGSTYSGSTRAVIGNSATGIDNILSETSESDVRESYSVKGMKSDRLNKGFNIVKLSDGRVKKVIVK